MLRLTTAFLITLAWGLLEFQTCQAVGDRAFRRAQELIRERPERTQERDLLLMKYLSAIGIRMDTTETPSDSIRVFLDQLVDDSMNHPDIRRAAMGKLRMFEPDQELERVRRFLDDPDFQLVAAGILVKWGYWDEGSPLLIANEIYRHLVLFEPAKAEPIVREAVVSASPQGRIRAAVLLREYGDTMAQVDIARDLIQQYVVAGEIYADTSNLRHALRLAYGVLAGQRDPNDLQLLEAGLSHDMPPVRSDALSAVWAWAREGDCDAVSVLRSAADSSKYRDVEEKAIFYCDGLDRQN
jgi:hypothetical protein